VFGLHFGAIAIGMPTGIIALVQAWREGQGGFWKWNFWYLVLRNTPHRLKVATIVIIVYGVISFVAGFLFAGPGRDPALPGPGSTFRLFSGHWRMFYWLAFVVNYTYLHPPVQQGRRSRRALRTTRNAAS
jgi:hypothetical protein